MNGFILMFPADTFINRNFANIIKQNRIFLKVVLCVKAIKSFKDYCQDTVQNYEV